MQDEGALGEEEEEEARADVEADPLGISDRLDRLREDVEEGDRDDHAPVSAIAVVRSRARRSATRPPSEGGDDGDARERHRHPRHAAHLRQVP